MLGTPPLATFATNLVLPARNVRTCPQLLATPQDCGLLTPLLDSKVFSPGRDIRFLHDFATDTAGWSGLAHGGMSLQDRSAFRILTTPR